MANDVDICVLIMPNLGRHWQEYVLNSPGSVEDERIAEALDDAQRLEDAVRAFSAFGVEVVQKDEGCVSLRLSGGLYERLFGVPPTYEPRNDLQIHPKLKEYVLAVKVLA